jgi:hypothetical protein
MYVSTKTTRFELFVIRKKSKTKQIFSAQIYFIAQMFFPEKFRLKNSVAAFFCWQKWILFVQNYTEVSSLELKIRSVF